MRTDHLLCAWPQGQRIRHDLIFQEHSLAEDADAHRLLWCQDGCFQSVKLSAVQPREGAWGRKSRAEGLSR